MADRGISRTELSRLSGLDIGTVSDFLGGARWPRPQTLAAMARALEWPADRIASIAQGHASADDEETVRPDIQDAGVLLDLPPDALAGLTPLQREEVLASTKAALLKAAREIRERVERG